MSICGILKKKKNLNSDRILTEFRCEKFEWFDRSPIEPCNPRGHAVTATCRQRAAWRPCRVRLQLPSPLFCGEDKEVPSMLSAVYSNKSVFAGVRYHFSEELARLRVPNTADCNKKNIAECCVIAGLHEHFQMRRGLQK